MHVIHSIEKGKLCKKNDMGELLIMEITGHCFFDLLENCILWHGSISYILRFSTMGGHASSVSDILLSETNY